MKLSDILRENVIVFDYFLGCMVQGEELKYFFVRDFQIGTRYVCGVRS